MRFLLPFLALTMMVATTFAANTHTPAKAGDIMPHALNLLDQNDTEQNASSLMGEKGVTLVFVRSVDWCPYCQIQMIKLNKDAQKFIDAGYPLVGLSYDSVEDMKRFDNKLTRMHGRSNITFLSDVNSTAIKAFGIFNDENAPDAFSYGVPHPTIFVVNKDKVIKAVLTKEGYKDRPEAVAILDAIAE